VLQLKRFVDDKTVYTCSRDEFHKLLALCRLINDRFPGAFDIAADAEDAYDLPLETPIGKHNILEALPGNAEQMFEELSATFSAG